MGYSLVHFLRHFPWKYYLSGGLFRTNEPVIAVILSPAQSPALVARGRYALWYENDVAMMPDAPPSPESGLDPGLSSGRSFSTKLLARGRAKSPARYVLLPELTVNDFYCNVHRVDALHESNAEVLLENLQEDPRQVFGAWDEARAFRWAVLSTDLEPLHGTLDRRHPQVMIVGVPAEYCERVDGWIDRQRASLAAIIPSVLACLKWFLETLAPVAEPSVLVVELAQVTVLAVFMEGRVVLLRQYAGEVDYVFEDLSERVREFAVAPSRIYLWSLGTPKLQLPDGFLVIRVTAEIMREASAGLFAFRKKDGAKTETKEPAAYLLHWATQHVG
ncbi:MAG: hypothetical protein JOY92_17105 [Verrucomicrobia bacterium]|nr:hypothetical protein [Verrucomicrobiota bacterium]